MLKQIVFFLSFLAAHTLAALTCSTPISLSDPRFAAYSPEISVNDAGDAAVAWILLQTEGEEVIQICLKSQHHSWTLQETLSVPSKSIFNPIPFVDKIGNSYVCWSDMQEKIETRFAEKLAGKPWNPLKSIISLNYDCDAPLISFSQDCLIATYEDRFSEGDNVWGPKLIHSMTLPLSSMEPRTCALSHLSLFSATNATLSVNKQGNAVAIWEESDNASILKASIKNTQDVWSTPETIYQTSTGRTYEEKAAVDPSGNICVVWEYHSTDEETSSKVQAVTHCDGRWSEPLDLSQLGAKVEEPKVCSDDAGNFLVVWTSVRNHQHVICAAFKPYGKPWMPPFTISSPENKSVQPQVQTDHNGHFVVLWKCKKNRVPGVYGATFSIKNHTWSLPVRLSPGGTRCEEPKLVFDSQGKGTIIWTSSSNEGSRIVQVATVSLD